MYVCVIVIVVVRVRERERVIVSSFLCCSTARMLLRSFSAPFPPGHRCHGSGGVATATATAGALCTLWSRSSTAAPCPPRCQPRSYNPTSALCPPTRPHTHTNTQALTGHTHTQHRWGDTDGTCWEKAAARYGKLLQGTCEICDHRFVLASFWL